MASGRRRPRASSLAHEDTDARRHEVSSARLRSGKEQSKAQPRGCLLRPRSQAGLRGGQVTPGGPGALHECWRIMLEARKVPDPAPRREVPLQHPGQLGERFPFL